MNWNFFEQTFQAESTLNEKLKIFILIFSILILLLSTLDFTSIFHLAVAFQQYQIYYILKNI